MKNSIIEKLKREINRNIKEECQVVYILSKVRKLLEIDKSKDAFPYLNMYCNWSLHNNLSHKNTISSLLNLIEKDIDLKNNGHEIAHKLKNKHQNFFKLLIVKEELFKFLNKIKLTPDNLENNWSLFMKLLLDIIEDSPINFEEIKRGDKRIKEIKLIKKEGVYMYRFSLFGIKDKPKVKLKFK